MRWGWTLLELGLLATTGACAQGAEASDPGPGLDATVVADDATRADAGRADRTMPGPEGGVDVPTIFIDTGIDSGAAPDAGAPPADARADVSVSVGDAGCPAGMSGPGCTGCASGFHLCGATCTANGPNDPNTGCAQSCGGGCPTTGGQAAACTDAGACTTGGGSCGAGLKMCVTGCAACCSDGDCPTGDSCTGGTCGPAACPPGYGTCAAPCDTDLTTTSNCGACGNSCSYNFFSCTFVGTGCGDCLGAGTDPSQYSCD